MNKPVDWPEGLSISVHPDVLNGLKIRVAKPKTRNFETVGLTPENYKAQRVKALKRLAELNGYDKVPASWSKKVTSDFKQLCKSYGVTYKKVTAYIYTPV